MPDPSLHTLWVERTARVAALGTPSTAATLWIVLHGYGQLAGDFAAHFGGLVTPARAVVAPEALSRFYVDGLETHEKVGASWMTRAAREHEITDYVAYLDRVVATLPDDDSSPSIRVLGFSQGAATASRWAVLGDTVIDRLVLWGGAPAHDLDLNTHAELLRNMDLTVVAGTDDPYVPPERRAALQQHLAAHEIPVSIQTFDGGHEMEDDMLRQIVSAG